MIRDLSEVWRFKLRVERMEFMVPGPQVGADLGRDALHELVARLKYQLLHLQEEVYGWLRGPGLGFRV